MYKGHQSALLYILFGILAILFFLFISVPIFVTGLSKGFTRDMVIMITFSLIVCIGMSLGLLWGLRTFCNMNFWKINTSIEIRYRMYINGKMPPLTDMTVLKDALRDLPDNEDVLVSLSPEYFGLAARTFTKCKGTYISFVHIHKKKGFVQYYIYPSQDLDYALNEFKKVLKKREQWIPLPCLI